MKYFLIFTVIIALSLCCCNEDDDHIKQINEANELLNNEIDRNFKTITILAENNRYKYEPWKYRCKMYIDLREKFLNSDANYDDIQLTIDELKKSSKWLKGNDEIDIDKYLILDFDLSNKIEYCIFLNKFLTVINSYTNKVIFLSDIRNYKFTLIDPVISMDKSIFKKGEEIEAEIFIVAADTTKRPIIIINNDYKIDTFNMLGSGIYKTKSFKNGSYEINGHYLFKNDFTGNIDSLPFNTKYIVK